jgi:hypothetical protein
MVTMYSQQVLSDPVLVFYCTAGAWMAWRGDYRTAAMCLGLAIGTKYTGVAWAGLVVLWMFPWWRIRTWPVFGWLIIGGWAYARNWIVFHNPFYPFGSPESAGGVDAVEMLRWFRIHWPQEWDTILYRIFFQDTAPWSANLDRPSDLGWWPLVMLIGLVIAMWRVPRVRRLGMVVACFLGYWLFVAQVLEPRYLWALLPAITVCGVVAYDDLFGGTK